MSAKPITPGSHYRVTGQGISADFLAPSGCAAIAAALQALELAAC